MAYDLEMIKKVYAEFPQKTQKLRKLLGRPVTLTEKILYAHLSESLPELPFERGISLSLIHISEPTRPY